MFLKEHVQEKWWLGSFPEVFDCDVFHYEGRNDPKTWTSLWGKEMLQGKLTHILLIDHN